MLVKNGAVVEDPWISMDDNATLPLDNPAIISVERWSRDRRSLMQRQAPLGLRLTSDAALGDIANALDSVDLIALEFPSFTDGRPYSTARLLRERYGFNGELRATGQILRDQAQFLLRCGFDAFELLPNANAADWLEGLSEIAVHYQPTADTWSATAALRHR
jgi:uncharacterized protein (DUF934 family)